MQETWVPSLGWGDPLEKGIRTHSSILAWRIPKTEEPVGYIINCPYINITVRSQQTVENYLRWEYKTTLSVSREICMQIKK